MSIESIMGFTRGDRIKFRVGPEGKTFRKGKYHSIGSHEGTVVVELDGDPYAVVVMAAQVSKMSNNDDRESDETTSRRNKNMTTATAPAKVSAKDLRRKAKALGVEGWEEMTSSDLKAAIKEAEGGAATPATEKASTKTKTSAKTKAKAAPEPSTDDEDETPRRAAKATSKSKAAPAKSAKAATAKASTKSKAADADEDSDTVNPYKAGSNLYHITEELLKGGKRSGMVKRLQRKIELKPRQRAGDDYDVEAELDRRILIVGQLLERDHGFTVTREGRGKDALIKAEKE